MDQEYYRQLGQLEGRVESAEASILSLWKAVERIRDRVPPWIALGFAAATFVIGVLITLCVRP